MDKIALFIAGDENIYFPALVTIESIKEKNPNSFDFFMCFSGKKLTRYMSKKLSEKNIIFIDSDELQSYGVLSNFSSMTEGYWPIDIFYNYALPLHFNKLGFKYSIKVDYDFLCIGEYDLKEILPIDEAFSGWGNKVNLVNEGVNKETLKKIFKNFDSKTDLYDYMNVGFISFNNEIYSRMKMFEVFSAAYKELQLSTPKAKLLEQIAFSALISSTNGSFKKIPEKYNHRVLATRESDEELNFDTKNIHFITRFKPWRRIEKDKIKWFIFNGGSHMYLYRNIWLEYASSVDGFEFFCMERPLTTKQLIALQMHVVRCFNEKLKSLNK